MDLKQLAKITKIKWRYYKSWPKAVSVLAGYYVIGFLRHIIIIFCKLHAWMLQVREI